MKEGFDLERLVRRNVMSLAPYRSARDEFEGKASISLDANENPFENNGLNRYPDPYQRKLKAKIADLKDVNPSKIFLGNGSDEAIDLLMRAFCEPQDDKILIFTPTYGMYRVSAEINNIEAEEVKLDSDFQPDLTLVKSGYPKLTFLCSPNNPTGNTIKIEIVETILNTSSGIVVIDEAYADFSEGTSWTKRLNEFPNLVVLQTFSKAFGLAGIRLGMAFASKEIIEVINKIKPPYNINELTQSYALEELKNSDKVQDQIDLILKERELLKRSLVEIDEVKEVYPSSANFLLVRMERAVELYRKLADKGIILRNRSNQVENAIRITIGTPTENKVLLENIKAFYS
ncbi:MAG: histidinol-phosphate transaminase [Flavobacteriales bacterium]|nr:histidinol-phosphate transaminase [Flavobacteriales bacterium]